MQQRTKMSSLITHPENLSKDRLKEELTKYSIKHSPNQNKDYYVQLYRDKIMRRASTGRTTYRAEFSSGDEMASRRSLPSRAKRYTKILNVDHFLDQVSKMSDSEMKRHLEQFKVDVGPIIDTTRGLYAKKLAKMMAEDAKGGVSRGSSGQDVTDDYNDLSSDVESEEDDDERVDTGAPTERRQLHVVHVASSRQSGQTSRSWDRPQDKSPSLAARPQQSSTTKSRPQAAPLKQTGAALPPKRHATKPVLTSSSGLRWIMVQLLMLLASFIVALIVFDYMMYGDSRVVRYVKDFYYNSILLR